MRIPLPPTDWVRKQLTAAGRLRQSACIVVEDLMTCLDAYHAKDRDPVAHGRNHGGEGPLKCRDCQALTKAKRFLTAYDKES